MRVTATELTSKEKIQINRLVDELVTVEDFTLATDFAEDAYSLFKEEMNKRRIFKSFWGLFKDIKVLYTQFMLGNLMKNVDFYNKVKQFFRYFITSSFFRELDRLDPLEALSVFLRMFQPPPPPMPSGGSGQSDKKQQKKQKNQQQDEQNQGKQDGKQQKQQQSRGNQIPDQGGSPPQNGADSPRQPKSQPKSNKSQDQQGLSGDESNLPVDMGKFRQKMPTIEKAIGSGLLDKEDVQDYIGKRAGIGHNEIRLKNLVNLIDKIACNLSERELDIFFLARKKELIERYKVDQKITSVPFPDNEMTVKQMSDYQEILKTIPTQFALDDTLFDQKLIKKELLVREYQSRRLKRQALYLLVDVSGSMNGRKNIYACAVALALVRQAVSEGSIYFLRFFDHEPHPLIKIKTQKDAKKMADMLLGQPFSGGGTSIQNAIEQAVEDISKDQEGFEKAEIMVITDGEDTLHMTKESLDKIKLHSTLVYGKNNDLKELSDSYIELGKDDL